jgi:hypothetical protein
VLPTILHCIRAVWKYSRFFNTPHYIVGLLRKVSVQPLPTRSVARWLLSSCHCHIPLGGAWQAPRGQHSHSLMHKHCTSMPYIFMPSKLR